MTMRNRTAPTRPTDASVSTPDELAAVELGDAIVHSRVARNVGCGDAVIGGVRRVLE